MQPTLWTARDNHRTIPQTGAVVFATGFQGLGKALAHIAAIQPADWWVVARMGGPSTRTKQSRAASALGGEANARRRLFRMLFRRRQAENDGLPPLCTSGHALDLPSSSPSEPICVVEPVRGWEGGGCLLDGDTLEMALGHRSVRKK